MLASFPVKLILNCSFRLRLLLEQLLPQGKTTKQCIRRSWKRRPRNFHLFLRRSSNDSILKPRKRYATRFSEPSSENWIPKCTFTAEWALPQEDLSDICGNRGSLAKCRLSTDPDE